MSYFGFLWLFAYVLMIDFQTEPAWQECLLYGWLASLVCEEIRQVSLASKGWYTMVGCYSGLQKYGNSMSCFCIESPQSLAVLK